ncbi:MAG: hypothetical protein AAF555_04590 [Verrucomicrobiota bacterium]
MIRFLHIPKTAGTSFVRVLQQQYGPKVFTLRNTHLSGDVNCLRERLEIGERINVISGHAPLDIGLPQVDELECILFLRNPLRRLRSMCQHVWEGKSGNLIWRYPPEGFDIKKLLRSNEWEINNTATRSILGLKVSEPLDSEAGSVAFERLLERDLRIGITEKYDESLINFGKICGWRRAFIKEKKNVARRHVGRKMKWVAEHDEVVWETQVADRVLYELASAHFSEQVPLSGVQRRGKLRALLAFFNYFYSRAFSSQANHMIRNER